MTAGALVLGLVQAVPITGAVPAAAAAAVPEPGSDALAAGADEALARAKKSGRSVEIGSLRGESQEVLANPDGTFTSVQHLQPVRTRINGRWRDIDTRLVKQPDGSIAPAATAVGLRLSGGGIGPLAQLDQAGRKLTLGWKKPLPAPRLDGDTAVYAEVLPGVDLQVQVGATGFSHVLVVKSREAAANPELAQLRYPLTGSGVSVREAEPGRLVAVDQAAGGTVFEAPTPLMWDSSDEADPAPTASATPAPAPDPAATATATPPPAPSDGATPDPQPSSTEETHSPQPVDPPGIDGADTDAASPAPVQPARYTGATAARVQAAAFTPQEPPATPQPEATPVADAEVPPVQESTVEGPGEAAEVAEMEVAVGRGELVLVPDQEMLTSPETEFPVFIDPVWQTPHAAEWAMTTNRYPTTPYYKFKSKTDEGMGYCHSSLAGCGTSHIKRLHYEFPISAFAGKTVLDAEFQVKEVWSSSCEDRSVQLWWTDSFSDQLDWNKQNTSGWWRRHLASRDVAYGWNATCPASTVIFDTSGVKAGLIDALAAGQSRMAFGLRAADEGDRLGWKRFHYDAALRVQYNTLPAQPLVKELQTLPGGVCSTGAPTPINQIPQLAAVLRDADSEDEGKVRGQFRLFWDGALKWTSPLTDEQTSGTVFKQTIASSLPQNKTIQWDVRAYDGVSWSRWSSEGAATCRFYYDTTAPAPPTIASNGFPADDQEHGEPGYYSWFVIDSPATDVVKYRVWLNEAPYTDYPVSSGAAKKVLIMAPRAGTNTLYAHAYDAAGKQSTKAAYIFRVKTGRAPVAHWKLDDEPGSATLADANPNGGEEVPLTHEGNLTLGAPGVEDTAVQLPGSTTSWPTTSGPVINTAASFTVSAWVSLNDISRHAMVLAQDGTRMPALRLGYRADSKQWLFAMSPADADASTGSEARSLQQAQRGRWAHLVGTYDAYLKKVRLYVNGVLQQEIDQPSAWTATGKFGVGRSIWKGFMISPTAGKIDNIRVYDRLVVDEEIAALYTVTPVLMGRWKLNTLTGTSTVDDSRFERTMSVGGGATTNSGYVGSAGLVLNGTSQYAATADPVVQASESFTVAGWVKPAAANMTRNAAVFSQAGAVNSAFTVRYVPNPGRWQVEVPSKDATGAVLQTVTHTNYLTQGIEWDHLAVVYDAPEAQIRLYVRGQLQQTVACTGSVRCNAVAFNAVGGLQLGRTKSAGVVGEYWPGMIDEVWAFQGVASDDLIAGLANGTELDAYPPLTEAAWLSFDDGNGADQSGHGHDVTLPADADFGLDVTEQASLKLSGQPGSSADGTSVPVKTGESFSVAAWVKLTGNAASATAIGADGQRTSAFTLRYDQPSDRWAFTRATADSDDHSDVTTSSSAAPQLDAWTHLVGVYDKTEGTMRLYVNGVLQQETTFTTPWNATAAITVGRGLSAGAPTDWWPGEIDDVRLYAGTLTQSQISALSFTG